MPLDEAVGLKPTYLLIYSRMMLINALVIKTGLYFFTSTSDPFTSKPW